MHKNWKRKILGGLSITSTLFVFQACYGSPQDFGLDFLLEGQVKSKTTGNPIQGIKVTVAELNQYEYTNEEGCFSLYTQMNDSVKVKFEDINTGENGTFNNVDTVLTNIEEQVYLEIEMEEN